ncbi:hypothetical protein J6590_073771 [Homalodisca vitripennis]|nr:hypothetical protein J6590_073771 [Homalodisca vitripennis]
MKYLNVVDEQLGTRVEDNEADEYSARVHESSTHVAGSPGTETAAVSAVHQTIPAEQSSQSLENLLKLERDKNEELRKQILSLRFELPCSKCKIYEEETRKIISTLRLFEAENKELKTKINTSNFIISNDKIYLQKELESTAATAEEGVAFTVVTKKTSKKKKRKPKKHGDSHSRHLASLMYKSSRGTNIGGICKPGAGLLSVTPAPVHPPDHCCVLLAGTNEVAAGNQDIIFSKLEKIYRRVIRAAKSYEINKCLQNSVLPVPRPRAHNLQGPMLSFDLAPVTEGEVVRLQPVLHLICVTVKKKKKKQLDITKTITAVPHIRFTRGRVLPLGSVDFVEVTERGLVVFW